MSQTSFAEALGASSGTRYDRVEAAYDGMSPEDQKIFRDAVRSDYYTHAQIAKALRSMGYEVDRKQVQHFREKLALGKVTL